LDVLLFRKILKEEVRDLPERIIEAVAEYDETLMEKFFRRLKIPFTEDEGSCCLESLQLLDV